MDNQAVLRVAQTLEGWAGEIVQGPEDVRRYPSDTKLIRYARELRLAIGEKDPDPHDADTFSELASALALSSATGLDFAAAKLRGLAQRARSGAAS